jgi:hypothetical protein
VKSSKLMYGKEDEVKRSYKRRKEISLSCNCDFKRNFLNKSDARNNDLIFSLCIELFFFFFFLGEIIKELHFVAN